MIYNTSRILTSRHAMKDLESSDIDDRVPRGLFMATFDEIDPSVPPSGPGCVECLASDGWWLHLRRRARCGHVRCCDSSPSQHASRHASIAGHPVAQSFEPGEEWFWNYLTSEAFEGPPLEAPTHHPADQTVPGPAGRVPPDWERHLH